MINCKLIRIYELNKILIQMIYIFIGSKNVLLIFHHTIQCLPKNYFQEYGFMNRNTKSKTLRFEEKFSITFLSSV